MAKKTKKTTKNAKVLTIPAVAVIGNIVYSKKEVWAYYKISSIPYDFFTESLT